MGSDMAKNWRLSSISGALLALYFIPVWTMVAFRIMVSPIQGLFEREASYFAEADAIRAMGRMRDSVVR